MKDKILAMIRQYLADNGTTHKSIADKMGVNEARFSHMLAGRQSTSTCANLERFANACGLEVEVSVHPIKERGAVFIGASHEFPAWQEPHKVNPDLTNLKFECRNVNPDLTKPKQ